VHFKRGKPMAVQVTEYSLGWNPKNSVGRVLLLLEGGRKVKLEFASAAEFTAVASVLREADVFVSSNGYIYTGSEEE
jgi:hypothetical protein